MSRTDWSIRLARLEDSDAMPAIELAAGKLFREAEGTGQAGKHAISAERQRGYIARGHCLVAQVDGLIAGFITCEPFGRELHIVEFNVAPEYQRCGIGAGLLRGCEIDARNCGFSALTLTTFRDVPWNGPFYRRLGFVEIAELDSHARLRGELAKELEHGMPEGSRVAMIRFLS